MEWKVGNEGRGENKGGVRKERGIYVCARYPFPLPSIPCPKWVKILT